MKRDVEGKLLQGIINNKELTTFMSFKGIKLPNQLKEFFADAFLNDLDRETFDEFNAIFESMIIDNMKLFKKLMKKNII